MADRDSINSDSSWSESENESDFELDENLEEHDAERNLTWEYWLNKNFVDKQVDNETLGEHHFPEKVNFNDVNERLLSLAKLEVRNLVGRMSRQVWKEQGLRSEKMKKPEDISILDALNLWLDPVFLGRFLWFINSNLGKKMKAVDKEDLISFIHVELYLSFYKTSPTKFFDNANDRTYVRVKGMSLKRYTDILRALNGSKSSSDEGGDCTVPLKFQPSLALIVEDVRKLCSGLSFVDGISIISIDDDQLRLRSNRVEQAGMVRIKNPKKGFGPVQHGAVSLLTGLFMGGHVPSSSETVRDCVTLLLQSMSKASLPTQIRIGGNIFALDRGYQSRELVNDIISYGGNVLGTQKRDRSFYFTFGDSAVGDAQKKVQESGALSMEWARRYSNSKSSIVIEGGAFRSGLGKVTLVQTTDKEASSSKWTLVPASTAEKSRRSVPQLPDDIGNVFTQFEEKIFLLTDGQRCPEWFLLRKFRITSTVASEVLKYYASYGSHDDEEDDESMSIFDDAVLNPLGIAHQRARRDEGSAVVQREQYTMESLREIRKPGLVDICRQHKIPNYSALLVEPLRQHILDFFNGNAGQPTARKSLDCRLLNRWFMTPVKTPGMRMGSQNEATVVKQLPSFVKEKSSSEEGNGTGFIAVHLKEYGLLCMKDDKFMATSPDGLMLLKLPDGSTKLCAVEIKTATSDATIENSKSLAQKVGSWRSILFPGDPSVLKSLIPDVDHRAQCLHHCAVMGLQDILYVSAIPGKILRVVHVTFSNETLEAYIQCMRMVRLRHLNWIYNEDLEANVADFPDFQESDYGYAVNKSTVLQNLALWRSLSTKIEENTKPFPRSKHLIPTVVATWNRIKGGIDVYSRYLKNIKANHSNLGPIAALLLRQLMSLVVNAFMTVRLFKAFSKLENFKSFDEYRDFMKKEGSLRDFCRDAAVCLKDVTINAVRGEFAATGEEEEEGDNDPPAQLLGSESIHKEVKYNKRVAFDTDDASIEVRLNRNAVHKAGLLESQDGKRVQKSCELCCQKCTKNINHRRLKAGRNIREGFKTSYWCDVCEVALCRVNKRFPGDERSCFQIWHEDRSLPRLRCSSSIAREQRAADEEAVEEESVPSTPQRSPSEVRNVVRRIERLRRSATSPTSPALRQRSRARPMKLHRVRRSMRLLRSRRR